MVKITIQTDTRQSDPALHGGTTTHIGCLLKSLLRELRGATWHGIQLLSRCLSCIRDSHSVGLAFCDEDAPLSAWIEAHARIS